MDSLEHALGLKISIVIPVYNGGEDFRLCLQHINQLDPAPFERLVVDDGSHDASADVAEAHGATVISLDRSYGPAHARNVGASRATGQLLFFVDADVAVHSNNLAQIQEVFEQSRTLSALIGSYDDAPAAQNFFSQFKNLMHHYVHQNSNERATTFWGACGVIRRDVFLALGGFDAEKYNQPSIEDIELGYRLTDAGYAIRLCKQIQVKHLKRWTAYSQVHTDIFKRALPWTMLLLERGVDNDLNLQWSSRVSTLLVLVLIISLIASLVSSLALLFLLICCVGLIILNIDLYRFFATKRGLWFTLAATPWHWFYYFYSGVVFVMASANYRFHKLRAFSCSLPLSK